MDQREVDERFLEQMIGSLLAPGIPINQGARARTKARMLNAYRREFEDRGE